MKVIYFVVYWLVFNRTLSIYASTRIPVKTVLKSPQKEAFIHVGGPSDKILALFFFINS